MATPTENNKKNVWKNLFRLIHPFRKRFYLIVFVALLSTSANLFEPLIYREAVNDIAGLFVRQAKEQSREEFADDADVDPITAFILKQTSSDKDKVKKEHSHTSIAPRTPEQTLVTLIW